MKALFFGTSAFAVPSLHALAQRGILAGVVTQPDRPAGRGHRLTPSPVKAAALELGAPIFEPQQLRTFATEIASEEFDLFALASYGRILPTALLQAPRLGALNVHPSLLPAYRGATPIQTALRSGETQTGVSIMLMDAGMDTGDIVLAQSVKIETDESYGALHDRLALLGAQLLGRAIDLARVGPLPRTPQSGEPSVTRPIGRGDLGIDWCWPAMRIVNHIRAYSPQPAARASLCGEIVKIPAASVATVDSSPMQPGSVLGIVGESIRVACSDGAVSIEAVIAPNRGRESGAQFYRRARRVSVNR